VQEQVVAPRDVADLLGGQALHLQQPGPFAAHGDLRPQQQVAQPDRVGGADENRVPGGAGDELLDRRVGDELPAANDDEPRGGQRHLRHQVRGHEHRPSLLGKAGQQGAHPQHTLGVQAVRGLVEHNHGRVAEQRRGNPQTLAHPQREATGALARDLAQAHHVDHLVDPAATDPVCLGQRQQVVAGRAAGVHRSRLQQDSELGHRCDRCAVVPAVDPDPTARRFVQPRDHPHGRGLPGAVGTEEPGDDSRVDDEVEMVDGHLVPVPFAQTFDLDHLFPLLWRRKVRHHKR